MVVDAAIDHLEGRSSLETHTIQAEVIPPPPSTGDTLVEDGAEVDTKKLAPGPTINSRFDPTSEVDTEPSGMPSSSGSSSTSNVRDIQPSNTQVVELTEADFKMVLKAFDEGFRTMKGKYASEEMQSMNRVLKKMNERQEHTAALAINPLPTVQATSSRAWIPLLNDFVENVQPATDRWRSTLDTVLIFVALFTAIVATFVVQAFGGLSEDPAVEGRRLIANLTEIYVISNKLNLTAMNVTQSKSESFTPDSSSVRISFYWSLALVLSVCIACLAVTLRGFVGKILRSKHIPPHLKLADYQSSWAWAQRVFGQVIELLPQLLAPPVLLFLLGFLDMLISTSRSLSSSVILGAAVIACTCSVLVGGYTIFLPLYKAFGNPIRMLGFTTLRSWLLKSLCFSRKRSKLEGDESRSGDIEMLTVNNQITEDSTELVDSRDDTKLSNPSHIRLYELICASHDDDAVEQAVSAIPSLIEERRESFLTIGTSLSSIPPAQEEIDTLYHLLSPDVSLRANIAAADSLAVTLTVRHPRPVYAYDQEKSLKFIQLLLAVKKRLDVPNAIIASAMARLLHFRKGPFTSEVNECFEYICSRNPFLALLAVPYETEAEAPCVEYAFHGLLGSFEYSAISDQRHPIGVKEDEALFNSLSKKFSDSFHEVILFHISKNRDPCLAYFPYGFTDYLSTYQAFERWLFTFDLDDTAGSLTKFTAVLVDIIKRYDSIQSPRDAGLTIYRTIYSILRHLAETTFKDCSPGKDHVNGILRACVLFSQSFLLDSRGRTLYWGYDKRLPTLHLLSLLNRLKAIFPLAELSDEDWHSLYASASKHSPRISVQPESDKAYIMQAFRQFVPAGQEYDLTPENESRYPFDASYEQEVDDRDRIMSSLLDYYNLRISSTGRDET
ncbi:hypothetical protein H0H93_003373 [Arthromyces matolae]|nr:hypothetical protein H0H93_003373 [Arthromyces matolae]